MTKEIIHIPGPSTIPKPWERQHFDTDESFEAFKLFRDSRPPRRVLAQRGYPTSSLYAWFRDHAWAERVRAYDAHTDSILLGEREALLRQNAQQISAEHMALLHSARDLAQRELDKMLSRSVDNDEMNLLRPGELVKLLETVIRYDRLIRGESTENIDQQIDLSALTLDELLTYKALREKTIHVEANVAPRTPHPVEPDQVSALRLNSRE